MWASQLLTLNVADRIRSDIISDFTLVPNYDRVERIELVMFNCPEKGISVQTINVLTSSSLSEATLSLRTYKLLITSCDSLVRVCITQFTNQSDSVIYLRFIPPTGSTWAHLAEVVFHGRGSMCPPDAIITTLITDTTTLVSTTPQPATTTLDATSDATSAQPPSSPAPSPSSTTIIIVIVSISCVVLLIVCLLAAVLILWRCYYVKHHNTSQLTADGEGHTHSHTQPVTLCEETGQVYYSTVQEVVPQDPEDMYSHISRNNAANKNPLTSGAEFGEYSTLFNENILEVQPGQEGNGRAVDQMAQDDKKAVHTCENDTLVDQLYAQVD
jgi:hypothetical protein